jgi:hypothetical protein
MAENPEQVVQILLERDPQVEKLVQVQEKVCCFLCGKSDSDELSPLTSSYLTGPRKSAYLDQVGLFKRLLSKKGKDKQDDKQDDDGNVESCSICVGGIRTVWNLNQQIESIKLDVDSVLDKYLVGKN